MAAQSAGRRSGSCNRQASITRARRAGTFGGSGGRFPSSIAWNTASRSEPAYSHGSPNGTYAYSKTDHSGLKADFISINTVKSGAFVPTDWAKSQLAMLTGK